MFYVYGLVALFLFAVDSGCFNDCFWFLLVVGVFVALDLSFVVYLLASGLVDCHYD